MKVVALLTASLTSLAAAAPGSSLQAKSLLLQRSDLSPVTRVVELLQGLSEKVEEEAKAEEDLYETFVCWAKTIVSSKTESNAKAASRKESLETYISDLDAGRIELTTERVDLEKEIAGLKSDIEQAEALRTKEHEDYLAAKSEIQQGKAALEKAITVLEEAESGEGGGSLLRLRSSVSTAGAALAKEGFAERAADAKALALAVTIGERALSKGDALFLRRLLEGEVPEKDWKKLNRKATFKEKYEVRSGKIVQTLQRLLQTFTSNLEDVKATETKAADLHTTLMTAKNDQKGKAEAALESMEVEGAARGLSKSEAEAEIEDLGTQITDDEQYIKDAEKALEDKKVEWTARKQVRSDELEAISKAISILHSDDARDLFKKSLASQGFLFLQESSSKAMLRSVFAHRRSAAAAAAASALRATGSARLAGLASMLASGKAPAHFDAVIQAIDTMIETLDGQEQTDLENKEACEKARAEDTREAITVARAMDELTDTVTRLNAEIKELNEQIEEKKAEVVQIEEMLKEAKENREKENLEWTKSDKDDEDAAALVQEAKDVLETFYASVGLVQRKSRGGKQTPPEIVAGEAPPPPPPTWEAPYSGKQDENVGIVGILGLIKEDIVHDREAAKAAEDSAQSAYDTMKGESETQIETLNGEVTTLEGTVGDKEGEVESTKTDISTKRGELEVVMKRIKDAEPGCDFAVVNYQVRVTKRTAEKDGLVKAKAILSGATFD